MNRDERRNVLSLSQFCIAQHGRFATEDWLARGRRGDGEAKRLALAARYLSMTSWYGYEEELQDIAIRIGATQAASDLHREIKESDFDLLEFSSKVRAGVARSQGGCNRRKAALHAR